MKQATKANRLAEKVQDEYLEVEHLYRILQTNIEPSIGTDKASYKSEAMKLLKTAMNALDEAATYIEGIAGK